MPSTTNPLHENAVEDAEAPAQTTPEPTPRTRSAMPRVLMAVALVAAVAVGAVGSWGVQKATSSSSESSPPAATTSLSAAAKVTTVEPKRAETMDMPSKHQSTRIQRSFVRNEGLSKVYAPESARTVIKDFNGVNPWFTITYDVVTGVPFGRFTDANATLDHRRLMLRIHNHITDKTGFLFMQDYSALPGASVSQLAFFVGPSGAFGVVHTSKRSDAHVSGPNGKSEWETFFVPALWGLTGALFDEQIERGNMTEADALNLGRRLSLMGDVGGWISSEIGGWAGAAEHAGTWAGSKVGRWAGREAGEWAGGAAGAAIGAAVGGPIGADIGEAIGADVGRWAGGRMGGWAGGKIGGEWGHEAGSEFGGDIGQHYGNSW